MTANETERACRLEMPADGSAPSEAYQPALAEVLNRYQSAVMREPVLDPVSNELIRIRCARMHDCRHCGHVRLQAARAAGADEDLLAQVDFYESSERISARHKVMLRLADAHIFGSVPLSLPAAVAEHLTVAEALEVSLLVSKYSFQKSMVALGLDAPRGYDYIDFDPCTGELICHDLCRDGGTAVPGEVKHRGLFMRPKPRLCYREWRWGASP
jgi:AhpD family alkylhydroperoxidase